MLDSGKNNNMKKKKKQEEEGNYSLEEILVY